jgi:NAD-dependent protein deacetylase/lipoamidase
MKDAVKSLAQLILEADQIVVFTGAGVSTESGLPDFRGSSSVWSRYDPDDFTIESFVASKNSRMRNWQFRKELVDADCKPNPAHFAIRDLETLGKLSCVITQNIDGLHRTAGNSEKKVIELHGTIRYAKCLSCDDRLPLGDVLERIENGEEDPHCTKCGGLLKAATVSFGEAMPQDKMQQAEHFSRSCDLFIVIGSSLVVYPAASMPLIAKQAGANLVIVNYTPTELDSLADVVIHAKAGETMAAALESVKSRLGDGNDTA